MRGTPRLGMGLQNHHLMTGPGTQRSAAETTDATADHDHLTLGGHGVIRSATGQFIARRRLIPSHEHRLSPMQ